MVCDKKTKFFMVIKGTAFVIVVSLLFAYLRTFLFIDAENTRTINTNISHNIIKLIFPLFFSPVMEELIFRKYLPYVFKDTIGRGKAIFLSNIIFSFIHLDLFFLPYFINGLIYSYFYEKTKDIKVSIIIHMIYNSFVFIIT